jgi:hypothetical protein
VRGAREAAATPDAAGQRQSPSRLGAVSGVIVAPELDVVAEGLSDLVRVGVAADPGHEVGVIDDRPSRPVQPCGFRKPVRDKAGARMCSIGWPRPTSIASESDASSSGRLSPRLGLAPGRVTAMIA